MFWLCGRASGPVGARGGRGTECGSGGSDCAGEDASELLVVRDGAGIGFGGCGISAGEPVSGDSAGRVGRTRSLAGAGASAARQLGRPPAVMHETSMLRNMPPEALVVLEPDVAAAFPGSQEANQALRALAGIIQKHSRAPPPRAAGPDVRRFNSSSPKLRAAAACPAMLPLPVL